MTRYLLNEEIVLYYDTSDKKSRLLWELISNSYRIINSVYIFKNFEEYCYQFKSDKQEDKGEVYWNGTYHEKLIDYIKIIVAFETLNKALLIKKGVLVHKIDSGFNKALAKKQSNGVPVSVDEFFYNNYSNIDFIRKKATINGLNRNLSTISFSHTLNERYQSILCLEKELVAQLKEINIKRNKLHLYTDYKGSHNVDSHINKWFYIKNTSINLIKNELIIAQNELNKTN